MKMLYTANGRYIRCCTEEGTRPVIIVCEKEYEVDVQEFMLWSILNWRILREEEISSFYEKMHIHTLRKKLGLADYLETVLQVGYRLRSIGKKEESPR